MGLGFKAKRGRIRRRFDHLRQRGPCVFVSIEAGRSPDAEKIVRSLARRVKSGIALRQRRAGMRRIHSVSVFEALGRDGSPKFGAHLVAFMPTTAERDKLIEILNGSAYGAHVLAKPVVDWPGLTGYLLKEATPQAWHGAKKSFRRVKGSIPLGELGGDRVVLSNDLKDTLLRTGRIEPYRRTYAKRQRKVVAQPVEPETPPNGAGREVGSADGSERATPGLSFEEKANVVHYQARRHCCHRRGTLRLRQGPADPFAGHPPGE
jgi:hypothetical protein